MGDYRKNLERAARLCSNREKCRFDVAQKMRSWGMAETEVNQALRYLEEEKFIDDERFARYFVKDKLRFNQWGRIKIQHALLQKRVEEDIITAALEEIDEATYASLLDELVRKKARSLESLPPHEQKPRLLRFVAQRGFTSSEAYAAMDRFMKDH